MLPDWAIISADDDDSIFPGTVVSDGFFDVKWKLKPGPSLPDNEAADD